MGRAPCCDKASVKRGPWSPEEDELLRSYVQNHGTGGNWIALPHKAGLNRCGKSCRLRWLNYLRPDIRHGGYTEQEDRIICSLYSSIGSRWSIIASKLPGRTDNDVKNYWNTKLKKKALAIQQQQQQEHYGAHHHQAAAAARGRDIQAFVSTLPRPAQQSQQCASIHPSPAPASSAGTIANTGGACSFGATFSSPSAALQQDPAVARYVDCGTVPPAVPQQQHATPSSFAELAPVTNSWAVTGGMAALDHEFMPDLLGVSQFQPGDLFGGGFAPLLQDRAPSLQDLAACYLPSQTEMWADVKPPVGVCHSLT